MSLDDRIRYWNTTPAERARHHPADRHTGATSEHVVRAIDVHAAPETVFRWLCQLRVAPYSYDLIDNLGRRSPSTLTPDLEDLAVGQRFAVVARIVGFESGSFIAAATSPGRVNPFGPVVMSWQVVPGVAARSRIVACLAMAGGSGLLGRSYRRALGAGDLVMMRRQLMNLRDRAEAGAD